MYGRSIACGALLLLPACGDSGGDSRGGTDSQTDSGVTSTGPGTPTEATIGTVGDSDGDSDSGGSASMTDSGTTTTTTPTTGPDSISITGDTTVAPDTTGTTDDDTTDTGVVDFCVEPENIPEEVPLNEACDIPLQVGGFNPVIEWKYGSGTFCGPAVAGQTIDSNASGQIDAKDLPVVFLYQSGPVIALWGDGSGVAWQKAGNYGKDGGMALGDLDGDGWSELVTANESTVCALDARDGAQKWCTPGLNAHLDPAGYSYPSVADMDGDGLGEVVVGSVILDSTGGVIGQGPLGKGAAPYGGNPNGGTYGVLSAVVDLDGDGIQEVVTGNAAYDLDGNVLWQNGGLDGLVAVADFDLDG